MHAGSKDHWQKTLQWPWHSADRGAVVVLIEKVVDPEAILEAAPEAILEAALEATLVAALEETLEAALEAAPEAAPEATLAAALVQAAQAELRANSLFLIFFNWFGFICTYLIYLFIYYYIGFLI